LLDRLRRLVSRLFRREVAPGRFEIGAAESWRGTITTAPLAPPSREYVIYVPRGWSRWRRAPLLVLCHGCRQTAESLAALAKIVEHADREGMLVLLPKQSDAANRFGCWNWFETNTERGNGEAAIVAAQVVAARRRYRARRERVWVAGLSAGGALAAVLGLRYPRLVRGVLVHSGLACGAASAALAALAVMQKGPDTDVAAIAQGARLAQRSDPPLPVALLAVHGDHDEVVAPVNATALVHQYLRFNGHVAGDAAYVPSAGLPRSDEFFEQRGDGYPTRTHDWKRDGRALVRHVLVEGLGHAWSGGDARFAFADPRGPDALALLARFVRDVAT
jgi:poly(3-hydroxybutyrate) depolymerase